MTLVDFLEVLLNSLQAVGCMWKMMRTESLGEVFVLFKATASLLIFCLDDLPIYVSGKLKSPLLSYYYEFLLYVCLYLLYIFRCFYVGHIDIYNYYVLLLD